ncbi:hypothetical protein FQN57_001143 [Myotisia sp. PD_48]|nr:hypothetical protein FQN57_001143 [Myotisia sp. PD_48]
MDIYPSLNASRPNWPAFTAQNPGSTSGNHESRDLHQPWGEPLLSNNYQSHGNYTSAAHKLSVDQERIENEGASHQQSRPIDFLKLVSLWAVVNRGNEAEGAFWAQRPSSNEAVKTLGRGLSFNVFLMGIDDGAKQQLQLRSPFIVYKKLRGLNDKLDIIERGELLRAVLLELRVLTHPPLKNHPNIIKMLHLMWEPDPDLLDHAWPTIVLEHAENGTLADFQEDYPNLPFWVKKKLCLDVGNGLLALHASGIVHGDLKSENILICNTDSARGVVAKLADFGCAVTDLDPSDTLKLPAFTLPWNAPESHDRLPRDLLKYTDVYSYGLLVWRITLNGANPFRHIDGLAVLDKANFQQEVQTLKLEDRVLPAVKLTLKQPYCDADVDTGLIFNILELTLRLDASIRDLPGSLTLLGQPACTSASTTQPLMKYEYENIDISLSTTAITPMCLQLSVIRELEALSTKPGSLGGLACLKLFELYMERLDWPDAHEFAAKWYIKAIEHKSTVGIARYAAAVFETLQHPIPPSIEPVEILKLFASRGCYYSLLELRKRSPSDVLAVRQGYSRLGGLLRLNGDSGVGLDTFGGFEGFFNHLLAIGQATGRSLAEILVSKADEHLLQAAAHYGCARAIDILLDLGVDIDSVNEEGETVLFQACKAGNLEATELLLRRGATVPISAKNGETPLHWAFAFDEGEIERVIQLLLSNGGSPCLYALVAIERFSPGHHLSLYGSPVHYAILARNELATRVLLCAGADPFIDYNDELADNPITHTPFRLAVMQLLPGIVKLIISSPAFASTLKSYLDSRTESLLQCMIEISKKPVIHVTLGTKYVEVLIETIDLLRSLEINRNIRLKPLEPIGLLYFSIVNCMPVEVIEHLINTGCKEALESVFGSYAYTPLQTAMYLNRRDVFLLLLNYGANIHRKLVYPDGFSYLQFCAHLGNDAVFFASSLINHGLVLKKYDIELWLADSRHPNCCEPIVLAVMMGNFELATFLIKSKGSTQIVPEGYDILSLMLRFLPRLPVSRLRYLLEPPEGIEPVKLFDISKPRGKNCFHTLTGHPTWGELELVVNFRYLYQQSQLQARTDVLNQMDALGMPPILPAILLGHVELIQEMLRAGANPNLGFLMPVNWAYMCLSRLQKSPHHTFSAFGGAILSKREARWLQEDYKTIIALLKQYRGVELRSPNGMLTFLVPPPVQFNPAKLEARPRDRKLSRQIGFEYGKSLALQEGFWLALRKIMPLFKQAVKPEQSDIISIRKGIKESYARYQSDLAIRNRDFSDEDSNTGSGLGRLIDKFENLKNFAKWYSHPPEREIQDNNLLPPPLPSPYRQDPYPEQSPFASVP